MTRILLSVLLLAGIACAGEKAAPQTKDANEKRPVQILCPITNEALPELVIQRSRTVLVTPPDGTMIVIDGFIFRVRDKDAAEKAKADPKATFAALAKNGDAAVPVSPVCPVMGNKVNLDLYTQKDGRRIYVCCKPCIARVEKNWNAMLAKVKELSEQETPKDVKEM